MNYAAACQLCKSHQPGKPYIRCHDCEIFLCSQCDYNEHYQQKLRENRSPQQPKTGTHKRVRICDECEEQECATQCYSCEQFLCSQCSVRLHQKGARQKHRLYPITNAPDLIRPEKLSKSGSSSVDNNQRNQDKKQRDVARELELNDDRDNCQISRKISDDAIEQYYTEEDPYHRSSQYEYRSQRDGGRQVVQNDADYKNKGTNNTRGTKGSGCYSSGGSSAGSHHNSYSNYNRGYNDSDSYYQGSQYNNQQYQRSQNKPQVSKKYQGGSSHPNNHNSTYYQQYNHRETHNQSYQMSSQFGRGNSNNGRRGSNREQNNSNLAPANQQQLQQQQDIIPSQFFEGDQIVIPIWQPLVKCDDNQKEMFVIQKELFNFAFKGELLIESNLFLGVLADRLQISEAECQRLIDSAVSQKIIHQTTRNFMKMRTLVFLSPKLDIISHECICWAMQSLKRDEMTPTEKTLQNRIKEAFAFKISTSLWEYIIQSLESTDYKQSTIFKNKHQITIKFNKNKSPFSRDNLYNENTDDQNNENPKEQFVYPDKKGQTPPLFKVKEIEEDPSIGQMTKAVYMKDENEWVGVDQNLENVNYLLYDELKNFLQEYFCNQDTDEEESSNTIQQNEVASNKSGGIKFNHTQTTTDQDYEEVRAIAGGRYGCAQFVKLCGPQNLRQCSLGRLAQLVQYAVKEDVLRYHKTLLVWTTSVDKHKRLAEEMQKKSTQNAAIAAKLDQVKTVLIEILAESKSGMSLAQLPLYLRRKLPFQLDLNELGFPKLKDLILSMQDKIKLELKGHNHPFAYLIKSGRYVHSSSNSDDFQSIPKSKAFIKHGHPNLSEDINISRHLKNTINVDEEEIQNVISAFFNIMREYPMGVESDKIPIYLGKKMNKEFNYKNYGCNSLLEFMKKYVNPTMDIEIIYNDVNHNDVYLLRSREIFMSYTYQQIQAHQIQQLEKEKNKVPVTQQFLGLQVPPNQIVQQSQINQHGQIQRQDSAGNSLNISSQCYIPNHQSLYGTSTSANTSTQINVSHIRFNTADTLETQGQSFQRNEIHSSINPNTNPFSKPPKHPQIITNMSSMQQKPQTSQQAYAQQKSSSFKTFPPPQNLQQQQQQMHQQPQYQPSQFINHQQTNSNATSFSLQSYVQPQQQMNPNQGFRGFFLSPSHLQMNKMQLNDQHSQNQSNITSPLHSRAISFNNSVFGGGPAAIQSTTSKSASQDFSIQSNILPHQFNLKSAHMMFPQSQSGFTSPNTQANLFGGVNFQSKLFNQAPNQIESTFGSPIPGSYRFDSIGQGHYEESPPYHEDDEDQTAKRDFRYIEKLVCDDDIDFKSGDEQSQISIQSPQLSAVGNNVGLRIPISNFNGVGPGINISKQYSTQLSKKQWGSVDLMKPGAQNSGKNLIQSSSCKNILGGPIVEGGSSSSEENKRPSTVHEQKTEEDAEDNMTTTILLNQKWNQLMNQQNPNQQETENLLFQLSSDIQQQQQQTQQQQQQQPHNQFGQQQQQHQFHDNSSILNHQYFESQMSQNTKFF